mgnify:CR=1 FL=1
MIATILHALATPDGAQATIALAASLVAMGLYILSMRHYK